MSDHLISSLLFVLVVVHLSRSIPVGEKCGDFEQGKNINMECSRILLEPIKHMSKTSIGLQFNAFDRRFDIIVNEVPQLSIMSDTKIVVYKKNGGSNEILWNPRYSGYLVDDPYSTYVLASFPDQLLYGVILTKDYRYVIDHGDWMIKDKHNAVAYREPSDSVVDKIHFKSVNNSIVSSRATDLLISLNRPPHSGICNVRLIVDYPMEYHYVDSSTLLTEIQSRIDIIDRIFGSSDFDGDQLADGIGFSINNLEIYESGRLIDTGSHSLNSSEFLKRAQFVQTFEDVCAGIVLTYRSIINLELPTPGGICNPNGNVVVVPLLKDGLKLSFIQSTLLMAHQLGHLFGSVHDDDYIKECFTKEMHNDQTYIMSSKMSSGDSINNYHFSPCSLRSIGQYIRDKGMCLMPCDGLQCDDMTPLTGPPPTLSSTELHETSQYPDFSPVPYINVDVYNEEDLNELIVSSKGHRRVTKHAPKHNRRAINYTSTPCPVTVSSSSPHPPTLLFSAIEVCKVQIFFSRFDMSFIEPVALFLIFITGVIYSVIHI